MPTAKTLNEVIANLEGIIADCRVTRDRLGYFPALYCRVTFAVRDAIARGEFQDGPRMERLAVTFANRYLAAFDGYRAGQRPTAAWLQAFAAGNHENHIILQHLLIGMNAHIGLDLGIAAAGICPGNEIDGLRADFQKINEILFGLIPATTQKIGQASPEFNELVNQLPFRGQLLAALSLDVFRDTAWDLATRLAHGSPIEQSMEILKRDAEVVLLGMPVLVNRPIIDRIKREESDDVSRNIEVLAQGEFTYTIKAP